MWFFQLHQNDFIPDLTDTVPWNQTFVISAKQRGKASGTRNNQGKHLTAFGINIHINDTAHGSTGTYINNFFLTKFTQSHSDT